MKQPIRYFSIGLITTSLILFMFTFFTDKPTDGQTVMNTDDMITEIKDEGYHVLTSAEYINLTTIKEQTEINEGVSENTDTEQQEDQEEVIDNEDTTKTEIHSYTLNVKPNMLGPVISNLLAENKIIDDAEAFNRYLEVEGYASYIQLGKYTLKSDMTNFQIAEKIAKKK